MRKIHKPGNYFNIFNFTDKNSWPVSLLVKHIKNSGFIESRVHSEGITSSSTLSYGLQCTLISKICKMKLCRKTGLLLSNKRVHKDIQFRTISKPLKQVFAIHLSPYCKPLTLNKPLQRDAVNCLERRTST